MLVLVLGGAGTYTPIIFLVVSSDRILPRRFHIPTASLLLYSGYHLELSAKLQNSLYKRTSSFSGLSFSVVRIGLQHGHSSPEALLDNGCLFIVPTE